MLTLYDRLSKAYPLYNLSLLLGFGKVDSLIYVAKYIIKGIQL
jgi:hypothetical protein